ncbi:MAG: phosphoribosylamine--glycine ligase [Lachnospiraceae bacterium]
MNVLIVGSGGREHAIATSIIKNKRVSRLYCAPGNGGIGQLAECVPIGAMEFEKLVDFAKEKEIDLVIVGMDDPLVGGLVDCLEEAGIPAFGPRKNAAILEGSKAFSKELMKKYHIPTAAYEIFDDPEKAMEYLKKSSFPVVLKADGLALGKGVLICNTLKEALEGVKSIMLDKQFGAAGNRMVIEEFMTGREVSVLAFVDGRTIKTMTSAQDHKRAMDGDQGLNTGGMGTFSPSPFYTKEVDEFCQKYIYQATVDAMAAEGRIFKGILFFGLMLTPKGPRVLEYNARFGDPEAQVVLPRMKNDLLEVMEACIAGTLETVNLEFEDNAAVCVILASKGYPLDYEKGKLIRGLEAFEGKEGYYCFHAGTKKTEEGIVTNGGRVLGITAKGKELKEARRNAYEAVKWVDFENKYMRNDIGKAIDEA